MSHQDDAALGLSFAGLVAIAIGRVVLTRRETNNEAVHIEIE